MENNILNIIKEYNGSLIAGLDDKESIIYDEDFMILKNNNHNYFCIFEATYTNESFDSDKIISEIEEKCFNSEILKNIKPQFVYSIIIIKTDVIDERLYKKVIEIEEDEYFCKKYVFYYKPEEEKKFLEWSNEKELNTFNELLNKEGNYELFDKKNNELDALKFMLRLIIKFIFIKIKFENKNTYNFNQELEKQIKSIKKIEDRNRVEQFNKNIVKEILKMDMDEAVKYYLDGFREN